MRVGTAQQHRGGETFGNVIALFKADQRPEWTVPEIQEALGRAARLSPRRSTMPLAIWQKMVASTRLAGSIRDQDFGFGLDIEGIEGDDGTNRSTEHVTEKAVAPLG